jgi:hypothetical protein
VKSSTVQLEVEREKEKKEYQAEFSWQSAQPMIRVSTAGFDPNFGFASSKRSPILHVIKVQAQSCTHPRNMSDDEMNIDDGTSHLAEPLLSNNHPLS